MAVPVRMLEVYDSIVPDERTAIHTLLATWLLSDDSKLNYDASFIISQRRIREATGAVSEAIAKFGQKTGPESRHFVENLKRIVRELTTGD